MGREVSSGQQETVRDARSAFYFDGSQIVTWTEVASDGTSVVKAQSLTTSGLPRLPVGGLPLSTETGVDMGQPRIVNQETVAWRHRTASGDELRAQRFDLSSGQALWEPEGRVLTGGAGTTIVELDGLMVMGPTLRLAWSEPDGSGFQSVHSIDLDLDGLPLSAPKLLSSTATLKSGLSVSFGALDDAVVRWVDRSTARGDGIAGQNVTLAGELGPAGGSVFRGLGLSGAIHAGYIEPIGGEARLLIDPSATFTNNGPFGIILGYGSPASATFGGQTVYVDLSGPELLGLPVMPAGDTDYFLPIPNDAALIGQRAVHPGRGVRRERWSPPVQRRGRVPGSLSPQCVSGVAPLPKRCDSGQPLATPAPARTSPPRESRTGAESSPGGRTTGPRW